MQDEDNFKNEEVEEEIIASDEEGLEEKNTDKLKKLRHELDESKKEKQQLLEDLQRAKADFVNMRRRDNDEREQFIKLSNEQLLLDLLPALDEFELAFRTDAWQEAPTGFKKGIEHIYNKLKSILTAHGAEEVNPEGEAFDPRVHEAIATESTDKEEEDHLVSEVIQKGYRLNDKIIRSPKVKIKEYK